MHNPSDTDASTEVTSGPNTLQRRHPATRNGRCECGTAGAEQAFPGVRLVRPRREVGMRQLVGASSRQPSGMSNISEQPNDLTVAHVDVRQHFVAQFFRNEFSGKKIKKSMASVAKARAVCVWGEVWGWAGASGRFSSNSCRDLLMSLLRTSEVYPFYVASTPLLNKTSGTVGNTLLSFVRSSS